jgi:tagatose-6-phosphate ketose/aldose isomerase
VTALALLRDRPESVRRERGYHHTLEEILQQPSTWLETASVVRSSKPSLAPDGPVVLTGSGSSHYIGESLEPILARELGRIVRAVPAGAILTDGESYVPRGSRGTLVSFARSGDSPESCAAVDWFLENRPGWTHVILTCNRAGALATRYRGREGVSLVVLPERTNDRSLVMTSSFTNLWLAGRIVGGGAPDVSVLSSAADSIFTEFSELVSEAGSARFENAVFLGSGPRFGAAREGALKMLEMTDGRIPTFAETFLGLRHGPMCAVRESTLLVGLLSRTEPARAYERDLIAELERKALGARTLLVGASGHVRFDVPDEDAPILGVVAAQLLGLFRSLALGLKPDAPSASGVITRVVPGFEIH